MFVDAQGNPIQVDELAAQDEFMQGRVGLAAGSSVPMFSPSGQMVELPAENAYKAIESGFRFRTQAETQELMGRAQAAESPVKAAAAGVARALTFGGSDVALTRSGLVEPETLRYLKEENELASGAGEFLGILGSFATPSGIAGAGVRTVSGLAGAAASRATARLAGTTSGAAANLAVRSGIEAAAFGAGQIVSESALEQQEFTAEAVASRLTGDAIMGAAFGAGFSLAGRAGSQAYTGAKNKVSSLASKGMNRLNHQMEQGNIKKVLNKTLSAVTDVREDHILRYQRSASRVDALRAKGVTVESVSDDILSGFNRLDEHKRMLIGLQSDALAGSTETVSSAYLKGVATKFVNDVDAVIKGGRLSGEARAALNAMRKQAENVNILTEGRKTLSLRELHQFRIGIDQDAARIFRKESFARTDAEKALTRFRTSIDQTLKKKAGKEFRNLTGQLAEAIQTEDIMRKTFKPENSNLFYTRLKNLAKEPALRRNEQKALEKFSQVTGENFYETLLDAGTNEILDAALTRGSKRVNLGGLFGFAVGGAPGAVLGGLSGAAVDRYGGNIIRKAIRHIDNVQYLQIMQQEQQRMSQAVTRSVQGFVNKANQPVRSAVINAGVSSELVGIDFSVLQEAVLNMSSVTAIDDVENLYKPLEDAAPTISGMAAETTLRAAQFLNEKLPKSRTAMGLESPPSAHEQNRFKRYMTAVIDPESTLKQLSEGYAPSEGIEAMRRVYPEMYAAVQNEILEQMAKNAPKMSYQRLAYLNQVFGLTKLPALPTTQEQEQTRPKAFRTQASRRALTDVDRISAGIEA